MLTETFDLQINECATEEHEYEVFVEDPSSDEETSYQNCLSIINEAFESAYEYSDSECCGF